MISTTTNKKAIVDFLWDWAESYSDWGKLLISKIISLESNLSQEDRQAVFSYFLQSIKLHSGLPALTTSKPIYIPTNKKIELETLSAITGVNRLAEDQTVNFARNITIIYGENGTGKTGYSRILKTLGFSYDANNIILSNTYATAKPKSAIIKFKVNGLLKTFNWNGTNEDSELVNISVFNSNCVQISLKDRQLIVSPIGFHLFNLVSDELNELAKLLTAKIALHSTSLPKLANLTTGTPQQIFIERLSEASTEQKLTELSTFTPEREQELTTMSEELANLNKKLLQTEIQNMKAAVSELESLIARIQATQTQFSTTSWQELIGLNKRISELERKTQTSIKELAEHNGIEFYETEEFKSFIQAAENYIKIIGKQNYPDAEDNCVYCLQPLENYSKDLLKSYRMLLNDKIQEDLNAVKVMKETLIKQISQIKTDLIFHQPIFGTNETQKPIQPTEIVGYNKSLEELKTIFITDKVVKDSVLNFDYAKYIKFLSDKRDDITLAFSQKHEALLNLGKKESELKSRIAELKDRKLLSSNVTEIRAAIENHKIIKTLSNSSGSFNTSTISRKTTAARNELVRQNFNEIFKKELKALRKSNLPIELNLNTDKTISKISQNINKHALSEILSEGEQKAISLAEFLTELQLDSFKAPVIFDDPVNSLDHRILDEVAKRLIEFSKQRQIIIFTHSILLLHNFIQQRDLAINKQEGIEFKFHRVKENFGVTGVLDEVEEVNSYTYYEKKLNNVIRTKPEGQDEAKLAAEGYGHLRSAIEITVEEDLLKKTIMRYRKGIAFPSLLRVDGSKIDIYKRKLYDIYDKCCGSIDGHSSPEEISSTPTIAELLIDFDEFKNIKKNFK